MADPDAVVSVGGQPPPAAPSDPDAVVSVGGQQTQKSNSADPDTPVAVSGVPVSGKKTGFWADFGEATGGLSGLAKAPFTSSIPAELIKAQ